MALNQWFSSTNNDTFSLPTFPYYEGQFHQHFTRAFCQYPFAKKSRQTVTREKLCKALSWKKIASKINVDEIYPKGQIQPTWYGSIKQYRSENNIQFY